MAIRKYSRRKRNSKPAPPDKLFSQYSNTGKWLYSFYSFKAAALATGADDWYIKKVLEGKALSAGKFYWAWGKARTLNVRLIQQQWKLSHPRNDKTPVSQYNFEGNKVAEYPSVADAAETLGFTGNAIYGVMMGKYKSAKGFYWQKGSGPQKIDLSGYEWGAAASARPLRKAVQQFNLDGKLINTHRSLTEAARAVGCSAGTLSYACKLGIKPCKGFKWKYV